MIFYCNCSILVLVMKMRESFIYRQRGIEPYYKIWHTNTVHMICYVHSGKGDIVTEEKNYPLSRGSLYFIGADKYHYTLPNDPEEYERSKLFLPKPVAAKLFDMLPEEMKTEEMFSSSMLVYAPNDPREQAEIERLLDDLQRHREGDVLSDAVLRCSFARLLVYLSDNRADGLSVSATVMQKVVEYINSHISEELGIDEICSAVHISKYHFCRQFKKTMGLTVMQYILKTRIVAAKSLLEDGGLSVGEISEKCGFCSVSYFCRVFKEDTGLTPLQYRREAGRR